jgi:hypothetical protein
MDSLQLDFSNQQTWALAGHNAAETNFAQPRNEHNVYRTKLDGAYA